MSDPAREPQTPASWRGLLACVALTFGVKVLLLFTGLAAAEIRLNEHFAGPAAIVNLFNRWDSLHYLKIAESGYAPPPSPLLAFPPGLPLLIRGASWFAPSIEVAAVLVATILSFLPPLLLFLLALKDGAETQAALHAALLLLLFPTGFFLHVVYTESLFLTLTLGAFLAARSGRFGWCAFAGALAGFTKINAFVLIPALAFEAWTGSRRGRWPRLAAAAAPAFGIALYMGVSYLVAGDPIAFMAVQREQFHRTFAWPWRGALNLWGGARLGGGDAMMVGMAQLACIPMMLAAVAAALRSRRVSYLVWTVGNILVFTAQGFWISVPRLVLFLFPFFLWLPGRLNGRVGRALWLAGSTLLLGFFTAQFACGWWVS